MLNGVTSQLSVVADAATNVSVRGCGNVVTGMNVAIIGTNNTIQRNTGATVTVMNSSRVTIVDNSATEIYMSDYTSDTNVTGNTIYSKIAVGKNAWRNIITGNVVSEISVDTAASDNQITGNSAPAGIDVGANSKHNQLKHNILSENGIELSQSRNSDDFHDNVAGSLADTSSGTQTGGGNTAYDNTVGSQQDGIYGGHVLLFKGGHDPQGNPYTTTHNDVHSNVVGDLIQLNNAGSGFSVHDNTAAWGGTVNVDTGEIYLDYRSQPGDFSWNTGPFG